MANERKLTREQALAHAHKHREIVSAAAKAGYYHNSFAEPLEGPENIQTIADWIYEDPEEWIGQDGHLPAVHGHIDDIKTAQEFAREGKVEIEPPSPFELAKILPSNYVMGLKKLSVAKTEGQPKSKALDDLPEVVQDRRQPNYKPDVPEPNQPEQAFYKPDSPEPSKSEPVYFPEKEKPKPEGYKPKQASHAHPGAVEKAEPSHREEQHHKPESHHPHHPSQPTHSKSIFKSPIIKYGVPAVALLATGIGALLYFTRNSQESMQETPTPPQATSTLEDKAATIPNPLEQAKPVEQPKPVQVQQEPEPVKQAETKPVKVPPKKKKTSLEFEINSAIIEKNGTIWITEKEGFRKFSKCNASNSLMRKEIGKKFMRKLKSSPGTKYFPKGVPSNNQCHGAISTFYKSGQNELLDIGN